MKAKLLSLCAACLLGAALPLKAEPPWVFGDDTRYMALGDSLTAGFGAQPATQGFVYLLYQRGVFDKTPDTLFANIGVPGATSADVRDFQVPQVDRFRPGVVTLTVGANDLLAIIESPTEAPGVLAQFAGNLSDILTLLCVGSPLPEPSVRTVIVGNLYFVPEFSSIPGAPQAVGAFNMIVSDVVNFFPTPLGCDVRVADVFNAFGGFEGRNGLLLIDRNGAGQFEVHPTNAGYRVMADAFEDAFLTQ